MERGVREVIKVKNQRKKREKTFMSAGVREMKWAAWEISHVHAGTEEKPNCCQNEKKKVVTTGVCQVLGVRPYTGTTTH